MRTRHGARSLSSLSTPAARRGRRADRRCKGGPAPPVTKPALLVVSNDSALAEGLRRAAGGPGQSVVQASGLAAALEAVRSAQFAAVLLDLDMPSQGAWAIADGLLQDPRCPPLVLLTGQRDHFDTSTAIRAGALVDKSTSPVKVLEVVDQALALPDANRAERNAIQRVAIRWLRPCAWPIPVTPTYRFWGLNE